MAEVENSWYQFKSKDGKVKGLVEANSEVEVARFAGYPVDELIIEQLKWNSRELVKDNKKR